VDAIEITSEDRELQATNKALGVLPNAFIHPFVGKLFEAKVGCWMWQPLNLVRNSSQSWNI
jgi:hypothetical protein